MTVTLVAIINSLKVPKIKKILLYEVKFLVPNYSCLQTPWLGGYGPQIPVLSVLCPQPNLLNPPPGTKFLGTPLPSRPVFRNTVVHCEALDGREFVQNKILKLKILKWIKIYKCALIHTYTPIWERGWGFDKIATELRRRRYSQTCNHCEIQWNANLRQQCIY